MKTPDRLPPHSPESEQAVLGCVLLSPQDCLPECIERLKESGKEFYDLRHQTIYTAMLGMFEAQKPVEVITVHQELKDQQKLEQVGGVQYLATLPDTAMSPANLGYYLDVVSEKYLLRKMVRACTEAVTRIYDHEGEVDELVDSVESDILRISESRVQNGALSMKELIKKAVNTVEDYHQRKGVLTGIGTGFIDLDKLTTGFHPGEMVVIAARPSMGKTSLAMNIAEHVALDLNIPVGVFSLEMTADSLTLRMLCSQARVNLRNVKDGFLAERDFTKLTGASVKLAKAPLFVEDTSGLSILQLRAKARRLHQQHGIKLFIIDYLQLLHTTNRRSDTRQEEIADISSGLKCLAKELGVPVIVLSQLNRDVERERGRKPRMSDLRESGAIEQDADFIGLLYRPEIKGKDKGEGEADNEQEADAIPVNLLIAKQRNGPANEDIHLTFLKPYTRFESAAKIDQEDQPHYKAPYND